MTILNYRGASWFLPVEKRGEFLRLVQEMNKLACQLFLEAWGRKA